MLYIICNVIFQIVTILGDLRDGKVRQQVLDKTVEAFQQIDILVSPNTLFYTVKPAFL